MEVSITISLLQRRKWSTERLSAFPKNTHLMSDKASTHTKILGCSRAPTLNPPGSVWQLNDPLWHISSVCPYGDRTLDFTRVKGSKRESSHLSQASAKQTVPFNALTPVVVKMYTTLDSRWFRILWVLTVYKAPCELHQRQWLSFINGKLEFKRFRPFAHCDLAATWQSPVKSRRTTSRA